ncbi:MAG: hypothetical protein HY286_07100 [Planctomycetes bacterium]|nr:hypothetical protein [Planctomycetota bacterium]
MAVPNSAPTLRISQLASAVAHAVRNPLAGTRANIEKIEKAVAESSPEHEACGRALECIHKIEDAVRALVELATPASAHPRPVELKAFWKYHQSVLARAAVERDRFFGGNLAGDAAADPEILIQCISRCADYLFNNGAARIQASSRCAEGVTTILLEGTGEANHDAGGLNLEIPLVRARLGSFGGQLQIEHAGGVWRLYILLKAVSHAEASE